MLLCGHVNITYVHLYLCILEATLGVSLNHLFFEDTVSRGSWGSPIRLECLASGLQNPVAPAFSASDHSHRLQIQLHHGSSGDRNAGYVCAVNILLTEPFPQMPPGWWHQFRAVPGLHSSRVRTRPQPGLFPASLTEKKPRTSGLRRDISSMSLRVSSTSKGKKSGCRV